MAYNPKFMKQAFRVAEKSRGLCSPNPFVGAVIVQGNDVISTGNTLAYGSHHAEVVALMKAGERARGAEMYVTLEPCSHFGKTPPCADAIISYGIRAVYIGIQDPNPLVAGKGIKRLQDNGIEVNQGFFEKEIRKQLEYYLCRIEKQRPFVIWKAALSLDGKFAAQDGSSRWISCQKSRHQVHLLRQQVDVIITGIKTVMLDDPLLNVRLKKPLKQPLRVVLDPFLEISSKAKISQTAKLFPTLVFCSESYSDDAKKRELKELGLDILSVPGNGSRLDLHRILAILHEMKHYAVLLECGSELSSSFFAENLIDLCKIYYGNKILGGDKTILTQLMIPNIASAKVLSDLSLRAMGEGFMISGYPIDQSH